jgi:hypothetical protein
MTDKRRWMCGRLLENNIDTVHAKRTPRAEVQVQRDDVRHVERDTKTQETHQHAHQVNPTLNLPVDFPDAVPGRTGKLTRVAEYAHDLRLSHHFRTRWRQTLQPSTPRHSISRNTKRARNMTLRATHAAPRAIDKVTMTTRAMSGGLEPTPRAERPLSSSALSPNNRPRQRASRHPLLRATQNRTGFRTNTPSNKMRSRFYVVEGSLPDPPSRMPIYTGHLKQRG